MNNFLLWLFMTVFLTGLIVGVCCFIGWTAPTWLGVRFALAISALFALTAVAHDEPAQKGGGE